MSLRFAIRELAAIVLAVCMLTIIPAATGSFTSRATHGGFSVIHKNGDTPGWILSALERESAGIRL
jgi:hypothetical protein